jgi:hypothetical protein
MCLICGIIVKFKLNYIFFSGMQVIEWNGIPLTGISHDEVSHIISTQSGDEIEVVIRTDINLMHDHQHQHYHQHDPHLQDQYQSYDQPPSYPQVSLQHNHPIDEQHQQQQQQHHSHHSAQIGKT